MNDEYTPSTEEIREQYWVSSGDPRRSSSAWDEFDRWLAAHDAEVLRDAADALVGDESNLNPAHPVELAYINCTRIDAQELRHRADRIEAGRCRP